MSKIIYELNKELENLKEQRKEYLSQYGKKVQAFSKKIDKLEKKKEELLIDIASLKNKKDSEANILKVEAKKISEDAKAVLADVNKRELALKKAEEAVDERALGSQKSADIILKNAQKKMDAARKKHAEASEELKDSQIIREALNEKLFVIEKANKKAEALIQSKKKKEDTLYQKIKESDLLIASFELKIKDVKNMKADLTQKIQYERDLISKYEEKSISLDEEIALRKQEGEKIKQEHGDLMKVLKAQGQTNRFRSAELDVGFEKLERDQKNNKNEKKRLDLMKKEMLKKEK